MDIEKNKKIKVCFVSVFAYPLFNPEFKGAFGGGGAELQMSMISKEIAKDSSFDVDFLVLDWGQDKNEKRDGVRLHAVYRRGRDLKNLFLAPIRLFKTLIKIGPDVVVCRAAGVEVGISAIYARMFHKKMVYSLAATMDLNGQAWRGFRGKIFKLGLFLADFLVAQSSDQQNVLATIGWLRGKKNVLIKNSLAFGGLAPFNEKQTILWVGRCSQEKRPDLFLALTRSFPQEKFVMICPRNKPKLWDDISAQAKKSHNLEFIESVPFDQIGEYFRCAKVLVNTSDSEGFPNTFLQAAENGAVILSLNSDPDGFLVSYRAGIFCRGDFSVMKSELEALSADISLRSFLAENAYGYLRENHDIVKNVKRWKDTIKELIGKNEKNN
jgi:glycosyltransferase involved in cell wall biosynthesis